MYVLLCLNPFTLANILTCNQSELNVGNIPATYEPPIQSSDGVIPWVFTPLGTPPEDMVNSDLFSFEWDSLNRLWDWTDRPEQPNFEFSHTG